MSVRAAEARAACQHLRVTAICRVLLCVAAASLAACGKGSTKLPGPPPAPKPKPAVLVGTVKLEPGRDLPMYTPDQMEHMVLAHVKAGATPSLCSPETPEDRKPVKLTADGKLAGVILAASEFSRHPDPHSPRVLEATISDCRLTPRTLVGQIGDMLHIKNTVDYAFLPGLGSEGFGQTLLKDQTRDVKLDTGGVKLLTCGFTAPCGRTDIIVLAHPFAAATNDKGEFRIEDFPAGETVRLNAWHPLFHETFINVRVEPGEEKHVELTLTPKPPPEPKKPFVKEPGVIYPD